VWKLSDLDLASYTRWDEYGRARDQMIAATSSSWAPWFVVHSDDKKRARLNVITHLLSQIPYAPLKRSKARLPERAVTVREPAIELPFIPSPF
jgi:polyphosphate kinase 2 (PPK2 family)